MLGGLEKWDDGTINQRQVPAGDPNSSFPCLKQPWHPISDENALRVLGVEEEVEFRIRRKGAFVGWDAPEGAAE